MILVTILLKPFAARWGLPFLTAAEQVVEAPQGIVSSLGIDVSVDLHRGGDLHSRASGPSLTAQILKTSGIGALH
jgi:hypothetical protein